VVAFWRGDKGAGTENYGGEGGDQVEFWGLGFYDVLGGGVGVFFGGSVCYEGIREFGMGIWCCWDFRC